MTTYTSSIDLLKDFRGLDYKDQARIIVKYIGLVKDMDDDLFYSRLKEDLEYIDFDHLDFYASWIYYFVNDFDNSITSLDDADPTEFFRVAEVLEKEIKRK